VKTLWMIFVWPFLFLATETASLVARVGKRRLTVAALVLAGILGAVLALAGCDTIGPDKEEVATVVQTSYTPPTSGTGVGFSGNNVVVTDNSTDEVYAVVFRCQHGSFAIHGSDRNVKSIWQRLAVGDQVRVTYAEKVGHDGDVRGRLAPYAEKVRP